MLVIKNFKKIKNKYFGDWQVGKVEELPECYAMQVWSTTEKKSVTLVIMREPVCEATRDFETVYNISLVEDDAKPSNIIEDIIYHSVLEDMELFGESLVHYLNTI
jgi:hypothetical protein